MGRSVDPKAQSLTVDCDKAITRPSPVSSTLHMQVLVQDAAQFTQLVQAISDENTVHLCTAAALTWLLHDIIVTLEDEVQTIWRSRWTFTKAAYLFLRYINIFTLSLFIAGDTSYNVSVKTQPSKADSCIRFIWMRGFFGPWLSTSIADFLFLIRVNALYAWDKKVIAFTFLLWLGTVITGLALIILEISQAPVMPRPEGFPAPGCVASVPFNAYLGVFAWAIALVATFSYFFLTFNKFIRFAMQLNAGKFDQTNWQVFKTLRRLAPTMHLFFRDGVFYFLIALILQMLNLIFTVVMHDRALQQMGTAWMMAGYSVISSRLILNLRSPRSVPGQTTAPWYESHIEQPRLPIAFASRQTEFNTVDISSVNND